MNKEIANYIHKHTTLVTTIVIGVFLLLASGEYVLYRREMQLNKMVSEGLMQLKEARKNQLMMTGGKLMLKRAWQMTSVEKGTSLPDGTKVMMDGSVVKPDGSHVKMMEGQTLDVE